MLTRFTARRLPRRKTAVLAMDAEDAMAKDIVAARIGRSKRARVVMAAPFKSRKNPKLGASSTLSRPVDSDGSHVFVAPDARDALYDSPRTAVLAPDASEEHARFEQSLV